ncbi:MAG TPA: hypothetical protein VLC28_10875, partial [Flavitalea sp.]|nr:hypothetical protein [Flavitalea sp.]
FTGTKDLNLGAGTVDISGNVQVATNAGILILGGTINAPTYDLTKSGAGSLYLGSSNVTVNNLSILTGTFKTTSGTLSIKGSYNNGGVFTDNLGVIEFSGSSTQAIPATGFSTQINTLKINNNAGVTLNQALIVNNLDLAAGTIDLLSNILNVNTTISNASATSYVKTSSTGMLRKNIGSGQLQAFPVGNSSYNPVSIRNNSGSADFFTVRVIDEVYSNGYNAPVVTANRVIRTWDINKATANGGAGVNFIFNWNAGEIVGGFTPTLWHYGGIAWDKQTIPSTNTATSLTYTGYTGSFSPFAILDPMFLLPAILDGFRLEKQGKTTLISWKTMQEQNTRDFVIQRSLDGNDWSDIGVIVAAGNSGSMRSYHFIDRNPVAGKNLYRVIQRDINGRMIYTGILYISFDKEVNPFTVLSNPVVNRQLKINVLNEGVLNLYNSNGQLLKAIKVIAGAQVIDLGVISAGLYHIEAGGLTRTIILK